MSLEGLNVLVTRPVEQAKPLAELLTQAGAKPVLFPVFEIEPAGKRSLSGFAPLRQLMNYHLAIFASVNAVQFALAYLKPQRLSLPAGLPLAAVGARTARLLEKEVRRPVLHPQVQFDSEALLAMEPLMRVRGKRVLIVRGEGGRDLMAEVLRARGAQVDFAEVYRRVLPKARLMLPPDGEPACIHAIMLSSEEGLTNLRALVEPACFTQLLGTPLIVSSQRVLERARFIGFSSNVVLAADATDESLVTALSGWAQSRARRKT